MLLRLALENFVIIRRQALEFSAGLNVLTGETGAGKSILVDALGFLCGARGSSEWIRKGAERLSVEGTLDLSRAPRVREALSQAGLPSGEDLLVLRRELGRDGRSRCFANGGQVLVSQLRGLTSGLVWIVGQGEHRALADAGQQEWLLDRFAGAAEAGEAYRAARRAFLDALAGLEEAKAALEVFRAESEWLEFQEREIREAEILPGELERLKGRNRELKSRLAEAGLLEELRQRLFGDEGSVLDHLETLSHRLGSLDGAGWEEIRERLLELREAVRDLEDSIPEPDPEEWLDPEAAEERLRLLERLCRKYGGDEGSVLEHLAEVVRRLDEGRGLEERIAGLGRDAEEARLETGRRGEALSALRSRAADELAGLVRKELAALDMPGASLRFELRREEVPDGVPAHGLRLRPFEGGLERSALRFRPHPGEEEGDLGRVASGGELSRIFLALHAALGERVPPGCWVLDEVDQGIGGETANRVGSRLSALARSAQVLLVTHLPGIAARGEAHYALRKRERQGRPEAEAERLEGERRLDELARMLSGDAAAGISRRHAAQLLAEAEAAQKEGG